MASTGAGNIAIAPVNVLWRIEHESTYDISPVTDFDGTSFKIPDKDGNVAIVAFDLDNTSTLPTPGAGERVIEVDVTTGDSASVVATATQAAIDADGAFDATVSGTVVTVKGSAVGEAADPTDTDSGVTITICRRGKDFDLGLLEGDVEFSINPSILTVTAHQSGVTPKAALMQGFETLEATTTMQETQTSKLEDIYKTYGGSFTPGAGTKVFGGGTNKQGNNLLLDAARLELKPVNAVDDTGNTVLMLALPIPDSLTFSGESVRTLSITWNGFDDDTKDSRVSAFLFGDPAQTGI